MTSKKIDAMKEEYKQIEIPQELPSMIRASIARAEKELETDGLPEMDRKAVDINKIKKGNYNIRRAISIAASAAIVLLAGFGIGVNTSQTFAETVAEIPVLNQLAEILTIKEVHEENDVYVADLKIPGVEGLADEELQQEINKLVQQEINESVSEATALMDEDKDAWLAAGGKEEDYIPRHIEVDYQVNYLAEDMISFTVFKSETSASTYFDLYHYNYDLTTGKPLTLENMLGAAYKETADAQIYQQIEERAKEEGAFFFDGSDGVEGFTGITEEQAFYVNEAGNPVIVFNKYEIAPGYMGIQEFEIVRQ